ncbi:MAG: hypothetical protein H7A46_01425 [Verrucomicrobiales bacterium]|nr:hypothetical protein [Verrucomicrobiales bacterium]
MQIIPPEWMREKTTVEEIGRDWSARRKKHDWWCPSPPEWNREWESFLGTLREGGDLFRFSSHPNGWPEGAKDEGYVIVRDGVQVRAIYWVGEQSDYSLKT